MPKQILQVDFTARYLYRAWRPPRTDPDTGATVQGDWYDYGTYQPVRISRDARTRHECVVYDGPAGPDAGRTLHCPLMDFHTKFRKLED